MQNPLPWPERVCNAVWMSPEADLDDRTVAIKLGYGDWQELSAEERVRVRARLLPPGVPSPAEACLCFLRTGACRLPALVQACCGCLWSACMSPARLCWHGEHK